jgi:cobalt-zinc-cadmium efflux system outer membrane protein
MMNARSVRVAVLCWAIAPTFASAQTQLTLADALVRARANAPAVISAQAAIAEARARLVGAGLRFRENPEVDVDIGSRSGIEGQSAAISVGASQALEPAGRRTLRMRAAEAGVRVAEIQVATATIEAIGIVATAYIDAWHRQREAAALASAETVAADVLGAAERRFSVGDVAVLDVNAARAERARAAADRLGAEATAALRLAELRAMSGIASDESLMLSDPWADTAIAAVASLVAALDTRPDLRALTAEIDQTAAERRLAASFARPEFAVAAQYDREEGDNIVLGGLRVRLLVFNKAQEDLALVNARAERLRTERDLRRRTLEVQIRSAVEAYRLRRSAVETLEREALPATTDNEALARRSYEVGQISLADWLVLRREALQIQRESLNQRLELALLRLQLELMSGVLQ